VSDLATRRRGTGRGGVRVEARAKLNLGLAVGPKRSDGYHDLVTVFQSITLSDTLVVKPRRRGFRLRVRHEDASWPRPETSSGAARATGPRIPVGPSNLVLRAARLVKTRWGFAGGADITLTKRIPAQAGLGGGSADAAAAIVALAKLHGRRTSRAERIALALELGSDVPFAITGGTAIGRGRGERLRRVRLVRPFRALVAMPRWHVSTAQAFARIDARKYGLTGWSAKLRSAQHLESEGITPGVALRLGNTFERVLGARSRDFESLRARLEACGLEHPTMTGSGSAVFGVVPAGIPFERMVARFEGAERLYAVKSAASAMRTTTIRVGGPEAGMQNAQPRESAGSTRFRASVRNRSRRGGRA